MHVCDRRSKCACAVRMCVAASHVKESNFVDKRDDEARESQ